MCYKISLIIYFLLMIWVFELLRLSHQCWFVWLWWCLFLRLQWLSIGHFQGKKIGLNWRDNEFDNFQMGNFYLCSYENIYYSSCSLYSPWVIVHQGFPLTWIISWILDIVPLIHYIDIIINGLQQLFRASWVLPED